MTSTRLITFASRLVGRASGISKNRKITVVFRYDDYSDLSPISIEQKIIDGFAQYRFPCIFGVIPFRTEFNESNSSIPSIPHLSSAKIELLKPGLESGLINVALHGYTHENIRDSSESYYSEFHGLDYLVQLEKISKGKQFLEEMFSVEVNTFIPPWNTYDLRTISALEQLGFDYLSADRHGEVHANTRLKLFPATVESYQLKPAIEKARMLLDESPIIVNLMHSYDFVEGGNVDYSTFLHLLEWIDVQKDIQVLSVDHINRQNIDLSPDHFLTYKASRHFPILTPSFLHVNLNGVYPSELAINRMNRLSRLLTCLYYLSIVLVSMGIAILIKGMIFTLSPAYEIDFQIGFTAIFLLLSLYPLRDLALGPRGAVIVAATIGILLGIWVPDI